MKKTSIFIMWLTIQIIVIFIAAIGVSFLTEWIETTPFFGDTIYKGRYVEWGVRHNLYATFMLAMLLISLIRIATWSHWYWEEKDKKTK